MSKHQPDEPCNHGTCHNCQLWICNCQCDLIEQEVERYRNKPERPNPYRSQQ